MMKNNVLRYEISSLLLWLNALYNVAFQARKERLLKMQRKDQENGATPKKHWKATLTQAADDNSSPSVASRSAAFETNTRDEQKVSHEYYSSE